MNARASRRYRQLVAASCLLLAGWARPRHAAAQAVAAPAAPGPSRESEALANPNAESQAGEGTSVPESGSKSENRLPWRRTQFIWEQSASGSTVGIGQDYLSRNPSYEMTFSVTARYLLLDQERQSMAVRGDIGLFHEFTNSDQTTRRGEWSFTDAALGAEFSWTLYETEETETGLFVRLPVVFLPTSKVSRSNGTLFGLGGSLGISQTLPLAGKRADALQSLSLTLSGGYDHLFTKAVVPTNSDLSRLRVTPDGQTVPSDQLSGLPFAEHQASFGFEARLALTDRASLGSSFGYRPVWAYELSDDDCIQIQNDCVEPERIDSPTRYGVITLFGIELSVRAFEELSVSVGYINAAGQIGPEGTRRNVLYSPEARFYLSLATHIDEVYLSASGRREAARRSRAGARTAPGAPRR